MVPARGIGPGGDKVLRGSRGKGGVVLQGGKVLDLAQFRLREVKSASLKYYSLSGCGQG